MGGHKELTNCYSDRLPYMVEKAAIYFRLRGSIIFSNANADLTLEQFVTLETIAFNPHICQRDLSKLVLKDRSNITRILNILEAKNLISREVSTKNKRPVKTMKLTDKGTETVNKYSSILKDDIEDFLSDFSPQEMIIMKNTLDKIIEKISKTANIQI